MEWAEEDDEEEEHDGRKGKGGIRENGPIGRIAPPRTGIDGEIE